jgi:hypothetical protein
MQMTTEQTTSDTGHAPAITDADLAAVARLCEIAVALWPTYATQVAGMSPEDASEYRFVGIDGGEDGDAAFHREDYVSRVTEAHMPMRYVLDNQAMNADAHAVSRGR